MQSAASICLRQNNGHARSVGGGVAGEERGEAIEGELEFFVGRGERAEDGEQ